MIYPRLLHPVNVQIEQINYSETIYDEDAREAIQQAARNSTVTIPGQVKYGSSKEQSYNTGGVQENERGYVLFRQRDLDGASVTIALNDRITQIGNIPHDSYISRIEPMGHYSAFGHTLLKCYFADRQPAKHG